MNLPYRYTTFALCALLGAACTLALLPEHLPSSMPMPMGVDALAMLGYRALAVLWLVFVGLTLVGVYDLVQTRRAVLRNYPIIGHVSFYAGGDSSRAAAIFFRRR